jgi:hypothetical protein
LYIKENIIQKERNIYKGPRVGLTLKKVQLFDYIYRDYRYTTSTAIKKNKCTMMLSEYIREKDVSGWSKTNINKWIACYEKGKNKTKEYFLDNAGISTVSVQCELLGYLSTL